MTYLLSRAKETSTWRGLVLVATACEIYLSPEQSEAVVVVGLALAGLIGAVFPDGNTSKEEDRHDENC
ncbi:hypothetical protein C1H71_11270 [Iodobacter fluviatilis]|uniref:Uncharacterized protein n=2 Tax=Iodobacter fluviatilis TaxID=537 RepID=A0A7G3GEU3_9NEIS|nr:hypothetical protein C1H71_11270 [Iodobacter fluviatilis]